MQTHHLMTVMVVGVMVVVVMNQVSWLPGQKEREQQQGGCIEHSFVPNTVKATQAPRPSFVCRPTTWC